jgi:hypothetical protein
VQAFTQNLAKKCEILKNEGCKLLINGQVSKSGMPFEVKSNNVMVFREQTIADFMDQAQLLERYHTACLSAKNLFQHQTQGDKPGMQRPAEPRINIQLSINKSLMRAKTRLSGLGQKLDQSQKAISYEEQMRNMQLLELNKKEMLQLKAELFTVKKDYEKLENEQQRQGVSFHKYKTLARVAQEKARKLGCQISDVEGWLSELRGSVKDGAEEWQMAPSEVSGTQTQADTATADEDGSIGKQIKSLEVILQGDAIKEKDANAGLGLQQKHRFFDVRQILKLNADATSRLQHLQRTAMVPEDNTAQFTIEEAPKASLKDPNDRPVKPVSDYVASNDAKAQEQSHLQRSFLK